jgi:hypothetical protein
VFQDGSARIWSQRGMKAEKCSMFGRNDEIHEFTF